MTQIPTERRNTSLRLWAFKASPSFSINFFSSSALRNMIPRCDPIGNVGDDDSVAVPPERYKTYDHKARLHREGPFNSPATLAQLKLQRGITIQR